MAEPLTDPPAGPTDGTPPHDPASELGDDLVVATADGVLRIRLNRPHVYNAMTPPMVDGLAALLERASSRDDVRVVLLVGTGAAFSTGADISGENAHEHLDETSLVRANRMTRAVVSCTKPVVAAVNGVAAGVGSSLALAADVVVATESASLIVSFSRIGLMPDGGTTATVAAAVGRTRAMRMALLGDALSAQEAYDAGLVSRVVPDDDFADAVEKVVGRLAAGPPLAYAATKRAINAATLPHLEDALDRERVGQTMLLRTADTAEGMRAFSERRRPVFRGE